MKPSTPEENAWRPRFFTVFSSQAVSLVGSSVAGFALVWWLTTTTGSATVLVTAALATTLPQVLLGPVAGALVDRWNRRKVMIAADAAVAALSAWMAYLFWSGHIQPWHVFTIMAARGLGGAFHYAAMQASIALMVPDSQLSRVAGLNEGIRAGMGILSPPLGALLISVSSISAIMLLDVATAAVAVGLLALVAIPQPPPLATEEKASQPSSIWNDLVEGLRYVKQWRALALLLGAASLLNLVLHPALHLMPLLVTEHFRGGAGHLATIESAFSVGLVVGGMLLAAWGGFKRRMLTVMLGLLFAGAFIALVYLAPAGLYWIAAAGMAGFGFVLPLVNGPIIAVVQSSVDPAMQGRVMSVILSLSQAAVPTGLLISGPFAQSFGVRPLYLVAAIVFLATGIGGFMIPELMHFEDSRRTVPSAH